jgi:aryl-alcohol dehydrogenase-like predicted oxidoreductase
MKSDFGKKKFEEWFGEKNVPETKRLLSGLGEIAKELNITQAQLALAWAIAAEDTSVALLGFSRIEQVDENLKAVEFLKNSWNADLEKRVTEHLANAPEMEMDWQKWTPENSRRSMQ